MTELVEPTRATEIYARKFYDLLVERATLEEPLPSETDTSSEVLVWRGKLLETWNTLGVSSIYYTRVRNIFIKYDCVTYLQRGTRAYDSVLVLNHPPPENLSVSDLTHVSGSDTLTGLAERVAELEQQVKVLEGWRESTGGINIVEAFRDFDARLKKAETGGTNGKAT